jgi:hypothetical protein
MNATFKIIRAITHNEFGSRKWEAIQKLFVVYNERHIEALPNIEVVISNKVKEG